MQRAEQPVTNPEWNEGFVFMQGGFRQKRTWNRLFGCYPNPNVTERSNPRQSRCDRRLSGCDFSAIVTISDLDCAFSFQTSTSSPNPCNGLSFKYFEHAIGLNYASVKRQSMFLAFLILFRVGTFFKLIFRAFSQPFPFSVWSFVDLDFLNILFKSLFRGLIFGQNENWILCKRELLCNRMMHQ